MMKKLKHNKKHTVMKTLKAITVAVALAITPLTMTAQENLEAAFDKFLNDKSVKDGVTHNATIENDEKTGKPITYYHQYDFTLPMSCRKQLDNVLEAFNKDTNKAYSVYIRPQNDKSQDLDNLSNTDIQLRLGKKGIMVSGDRSVLMQYSKDLIEPLVRVSYGKNLDHNIDYGMHPERNYNVMLVRDCQDSLSRYAYAVVWYVDSAANKLCGSLGKVYGKDPRKVKKQKTGFNFLGDYSTKIGSEAIQSLREMNDNDNSEYEINNSIDFIKRFGNLRAAYKTSIKEGGENDTMLNTGLINKMVELCKLHGKKLSTNEQDLCVSELKELQADTYDKYLKHLLGVAIKYMRP